MKLRSRFTEGILLACALIACIGAAAAAAEKPDPSGTWKWTFSPPNSEAVEVSAELKLEGDKLTGKVTAGDRSFDISDGTFVENQVAFNVVAENDGVKVTAKFKGTIEADSIAGKTEIDVNGQMLTVDWNATRQK